jgi:hypothetical protein
VLSKILAALLHLDEDDRLPHKISKRSATGSAVSDAHPQDRSGLFDASVAETLKQPVKEDLSLALFVAGNLLAAPGYERR